MNHQSIEEGVAILYETIHDVLGPIQLNDNKIKKQSNAPRELVTLSAAHSPDIRLVDIAPHNKPWWTDGAASPSAANPLPARSG